MITYKIFTSYKELPPSWNALVAHDLFLQTDYLQALEEGAPETISLYYVGVFDKQNLVGVSLLQRVQVYAKDVFRSYSSSFLNAIFKLGISKILKGNVLVVGNLTHTGQHGLFFKPQALAQNEFLKLIFDAVDELTVYIRNEKNKRIRVVMFKDFFLDDPIHLEQEAFNKVQLHKVLVQPNMIMNLKPTWKDFEKYYDDLNKKYKRRVRTARKKMNAIECRELDLADIEGFSDRFHKLYLNVSNNAKFNTFLLPKNHFYVLKSNLKDRFKLFGYFLEDEMVGFYSLLVNNDVLETYFLGYNAAYQYQNQMYLNMLYDMLEFAISNQFNSIVYARTAMEIKSSVGARKVEMNMYMKHTNKVANFMFKQIFNLMNPTQSWVERHPFK